MDRFVRAYRAVDDGDLTLCPDEGVAYQSDMSLQVPYDDAYFQKCAAKEGGDVAFRLNLGRCAFVNRWVGPHEGVLDVGIGTGEFIRRRHPNTYGTDVNPRAIDWLVQHKKLAPFFLFRAFTFWDVLEHVATPEVYFRQMRQGSYVFASIPTFLDLGNIRASKHYRPGEHLYYWTDQGFVDWMGRYGFTFLEQSDFETRAGRTAIRSFAFRRDYPAAE